MNKYLVIACLVLLTVCILSIRTCQSVARDKQAIENNLAAANDTIKYHKDRENAYHAIILAQEGTIIDLKVTDQATIDTITKRLQITEKQLEGAQYANARLETSFNDYVNTTKRGDTTGTIDHKTQYQHFHETDIDSGNVRIAYITDTSEAPIHLTEYSKGSNPFKPKLHYVDGYSDNPNVKITGLSSVMVVKEKPKAIGYLEGGVAGLLIGLILHVFIH